ILYYDDSQPVLDFVNSEQARELALTGAACPDHLVHTKYLPLFVDYDPQKETVASLAQRIGDEVEAYARAYEAYVEKSRAEAKAQGAEVSEGTDDPYPRVILIPGLGMIATGKDKSTA